MVQQHVWQTSMKYYRGESCSDTAYLVWNWNNITNNTSDEFNTLRPRQDGCQFPFVFSWMKIYEFRLRFHWTLFLRVQLTIFQHWFRWWLGTSQVPSHYLNQWWLICWHIYASLGLNELMLKCWNKPLGRIYGKHYFVVVYDVVPVFCCYGGCPAAVNYVLMRAGLVKLNPRNTSWSMVRRRSLSVGVNWAFSIVKSVSKLLTSLGDFWNGQVIKHSTNCSIVTP